MNNKFQIVHIDGTFDIYEFQPEDFRLNNYHKVAQFIPDRYLSLYEASLNKNGYVNQHCGEYSKLYTKD